MIPIGIQAPLDLEGGGTVTSMPEKLHNFLMCLWVCTPIPQDCTPLMLPYTLATVYNSYNACK